MKKTIITFLYVISIFAYGASEKDLLETVKLIIDKKGIDFMLQNTVDRMQKEYPKKMDILDTVTRVYYIKLSNTRVIEHTLNPNWRTIIKADHNITIKQVEDYTPELMRLQAINTACSIPLEKMFLDYSVKFVNIYKEIDGTRLFNTIVEKKDCSNKNKLRKLND